MRKGEEETTKIEGKVKDTLRGTSLLVRIAQPVNLLSHLRAALLEVPGPREAPRQVHRGARPAGGEGVEEGVLGQTRE